MKNTTRLLTGYNPLQEIAGKPVYAIDLIRKRIVLGDNSNYTITKSGKYLTDGKHRYSTKNIIGVLIDEKDLPSYKE